MKTRPTFKSARSVSCGLFATVCLSVLTPQLHAVDILWTGTLTAGPYPWSTATNWTGSAVPDTNTERGDLRVDWTAAPIFNLTAATTVNGILADDAGTGTDVILTLANGGAAANTLTLAGTTPVIQVDGSSLTVSAVVAGSTAWSKTGAGSMVLSGANTFTAPLTLSAGFITVGNATALGTAVGNTTVASGATLNLLAPLAAAATVAEPLVLNGHATANSLRIGSSLTSTLSGTISLSGTVSNRIQTDGGTTLTLSGIVSGTSGFTTSQPGTLILTNTGNTFSGDVLITDGVTRSTVAGGLGAATNIVVENAANPAASDTNSLQLAGAFTQGAGKTLTLRNNSTSNIGNARTQLESQAGATIWAGNILFDQGTNQTLAAATGTTLTLTGILTNSGTPSTSIFLRGVGTGVINGPVLMGTTTLYKTDTGTWTINTSGNTNGAVRIGNGTLVLNNNNAVSPTTNLSFGEGNANVTTLTINAGFTQELAAVATESASTVTASHRLNGAGSLTTGSTNRTFTVNNHPAADDLTISTPILGSGGFTKTGAGTLVLSNSAVTGPVTISAGTLRGEPTFGTSLTLGDTSSFTLGSTATAVNIPTPALTFGAGATSLTMNAGPGGDQITVAGADLLTVNGTTTINVVRYGSSLPVGVYPLINYSGTIQGTGGFAVGTLPPRLAATIIDTGTTVALNVTASDYLVWTGTNNASWDATTADNWNLFSTSAPLLYQDAEAITFGDTGLNPTVVVAGAVNPGWLTISNSITGPAWRFTGAAINGTGGITKTNTGLATIANTVGLTGSVLVQGGTLEIDHDTGSLTGAAGVDVAAGATLLLSKDNGDFTFNRNLTGAGTVVIDPVTSTVGAASRAVTLSGTNTGFSGVLKLTPSGTVATNGSFRTVNTIAQANLGTASIVVGAGGQLWFSSPITNNVTITGTGYNEPAGGPPATAATDLAGNPLTVPGFTYSGIGALRMEAAAVITGNVTLDGTAKIMPYNTTAKITGTITNTNATDTLVIGGGGAGSTLIASGDLTGLERIWINGGGTTGTNVLQVGENGTTGTLAANVDLILYNDAAGAGLRFNRSDGFALGAGQKIIAAHNGTATNLSKSTLTINTTGSGFTVGANPIDLSDGTSGGIIYVGGSLGGANGVAGSLLNIGAGSVVEAGSLHLGDGAGWTATVEQTGGTTTLINQLRVGHYAANGTYNLSGGSLTLLAASPATTPSSAGVAEQNGGIYLGIDGTGVFNQSAGTVTTNFVVLDNRGDTAGTDQYNLSGGTLNLGGAWGIIRRNATAELNFSGGTIRNTGSGLIATIDCPLTVSNTPVLDTTSAANSFTLVQGLAGTAGTLTAQGGGTVFLNGTSTFAGTLAIADATVLGGTGTFPGTASVTHVSPGTTTAYGSAGTLTLGDPGASTTTTTVAGTGTFDLNAASTVSGNDGVIVKDDLNLTAATILPRFYNGIPVAGTYPLFTYTGTLTGTPVFDSAFVPGNQRMSFTLDSSVAGVVNLTLAGTTGNLTWLGDGVSSLWDLNTTASWTASPTFYQLDAVTFGDAGDATLPITLVGTLIPSTVTVNATVKNYTFAGSGSISGGALLTKDGASQLTVLTNNSYTGITDVLGGVLQVGSGGNVGTLGTGTITTSSGAELQFNRADAITIPNVLAGGGTLVQEGTGTLTLSGTNTLSGPVRVEAGILKAANVAAFGTSSGIAIQAGGQVNLNGTAFGNTRSYSYSMVGNGGDGRGALINEVVSIGANASVVNLTITGDAAVGAYGGTGDGNRFDIGYNGTTFGTITGGGYTLTKLGEAMVNVRAPATNISYVVAAGTLRAENNAAALGSTGVTVNAGARLDSYGALTFTVPITLAGNATLTSSNGVGTWNSVIGESAVSNLTVAGGNTVVLGGINTYTGGTTLTGGTLQTNGNNALGTGAVVLSNTAVAGKLVVNAGVTVPNDITIGAGPALIGATGRGLVEQAGTGQAILTGTVTVNSGASAGGTFFASATAGNELVFKGPLVLNAGASIRDGRTIFFGGGTGNGQTLNGTGTMTLGASNGLPTNMTLLLGGSAACTFDLASFNQTLTGLTKGGSAATVTNSSATTAATLTLDLAAANTYAGIMTGNLGLVKSGAADLTLTGATSTFTGNVEINLGKVTVGAGHNDVNATSALGNPLLGTRSVTVKSGAILAFATNDSLGNAGSAPVMPIIVESGAVLTNFGFNTLGPITLNGSTMVTTGGANATYQSYRLFGTITAGGTTPSVMSGSGNFAGYHLHSTTTFEVADATSDAAADLTVSATLINQSGAQTGAAGNLVKTGVGTLTLAGTNTYTGNTTVNNGALTLADNAQLRFLIGAASGTNNSLAGAGTAQLDGDFAIDTTAAAALTAGTWVLENVPTLTTAYGATFQVVNTDGSAWTDAGGDKWTKNAGSGKVWTFDETTGTLTLALTGYEAWAMQITDVNKRGRSDDADGDGFTNVQEFLFGTSPIAGNGALATAEQSGGNLIIRWLQRETGATYVLKESTTLAPGSWTPSASVPALDVQTGVPIDYDRYQATFPINAILKMFRVEGTEN
jgi:autotransporter-associated beta strand protein